MWSSSTHSRMSEQPNTTGCFFLLIGHDSSPLSWSFFRIIPWKEVIVDRCAGIFTIIAWVTNSWTSCENGAVLMPYGWKNLREYELTTRRMANGTVRRPFSTVAFTFLFTNYLLMQSSCCVFPRYSNGAGLERAAEIACRRTAVDQKCGVADKGTLAGQT